MPKYDKRIRIFLTLDCNLACPYCVNREFAPIATYAPLPAVAWARAINRIKRNVIFTGGEPFLYPELIKLVNAINPKIGVRIYSNLTQNPTEFVERVTRPVDFLGSYHPVSGPPDKVLANISILASRFGGRVHSINWTGHSLTKARRALKAAKWSFAVEGDQRVEHAAASSRKRRSAVRCISRNILVAPNGVRYPCVSALLRNTLVQENVITEPLRSVDVDVRCSDYGHCAACDGLTQRKLLRGAS